MKNFMILVILLAALALAVGVGCADKTPAPPQGQKTAQPLEEEQGGTETAIAGVTPVTEAAAGTPPARTQAGPSTALVLVADRLTTLDPYFMVTTHPEESVASHLWDPLVRLNGELQLEPGLAESWRLINNFTWEFKIRPGLTFHNGEVVDAQAARFSIERARTLPGSFETLARDVGLEQVEVVDNYTIRLVTREPVANMPYHLAFLEILPPVYYSETSADRLALAPVGSGPYQLQEPWQPEEPLVLEAAPDYWQGTPVLSQIIFQYVPGVEDRLAALRMGKADLVTGLPPLPIEQWNSPDSKLVAVESTQRLFIGIPSEAGSPFADVRVRQALNYGVDVEKIVDELLEGYGDRYGSWVNPPHHNPNLAPWPYDPELARQLLAEAGYGQGLTTTLRTPSGVYPQDVAVARAVAQQLGEIGLTVEVKPVDYWPSYTRQLLSNEDPSLFLLGFNSRGDGLEDVKDLSSTFAFNPTRWRNPLFEDTLKRAYNQLNEDLRAKLLNEAQVVAYNDAPWLWLWRSYYFYGVSQDLDWTPRRDGLVNLYRTASGRVETDQ